MTATGAGHWPGRGNQHFEQIAHLSPLDEGMTQRKLRHDLVAIPSALSLAQHVALVDELGEDPVGGAFGDPDRGGDVAQADARIMGHAGEDMGVIGQKVPSPGRRGRLLLLISGNQIHEYRIHSMSSQRSRRFIRPGGIAGKGPSNRGPERELAMDAGTPGPGDNRRLVELEAEAAAMS
jgi:hypothetical protein